MTRFRLREGARNGKNFIFSQGSGSTSHLEGKENFLFNVGKLYGVDGRRTGCFGAIGGEVQQVDRTCKRE